MIAESTRGSRGIVGANVKPNAKPIRKRGLLSHTCGINELLRPRPVDLLDDLRTIAVGVGAGQFQPIHNTVQEAVEVFMHSRLIATSLCLIAACSTLVQDDEKLEVLEEELQQAPASAVPVPADYDGDGYTDMAVRASTGIWYIDVGGINPFEPVTIGFGGRWDFAYSYPPASTSRPAPADYDGDTKADISALESDGKWKIDFSGNGFGDWDVQLPGWSGTWVPAPADFDRDTKADLSAKDPATGIWRIDYSSNGFNGWEASYSNYGTSSIPVPGDYNNDGYADFAVKDSSNNGTWYIDYGPTLGQWNEIHSGYGTTSVPIPADYDNDGKTDIAVKDSSGTWLVDYASDGFGSWDHIVGGYGSATVPVPGDYDHDGHTDLSVNDASTGYWSIDKASTGPGWDLQISNTNRPLYDPNAPYIDSTTIEGKCSLQTWRDCTTNSDCPTLSTPTRAQTCSGHGQTNLTVGQRYTVAVHFQKGAIQHIAGLEVNPALQVPSWLNLSNRQGSTENTAITVAQTRRYSVSCSRAGFALLGFMFRDNQTAVAFNPDYGIKVNCVAPKEGGVSVAGLSGTVLDRRTGLPIAEATVSVPGFPPALSNSVGFWNIPNVLGGPLSATISKDGYSSSVAINVMVPSGPGVQGIQINAQLEDPFTPLVLAGIRYTTYIDYSRGRTVLHTLRMSPSASGGSLSFAESATPATGDNLMTIASAKNTYAVINGGYFDTRSEIDGEPNPRWGKSQGYFYVHLAGPQQDGFVSPSMLTSTPFYAEPASGAQPPVLEPTDTLPMLTIGGTGTNQVVDIVHSGTYFWAVPYHVRDPNWGTNIFGHAVWDTNEDRVSDFDYVLQAAPTLLMNGAVAWSGVFDSHSPGEVPYRVAWPRTAVGVGPGAGNNTVYLVVADGEGVNGGHGATLNQLGTFFRDTLGATKAMGFDSGESTEMVLRGANGQRILNTLTSENSGAPTTYVPSGSVMNYLMIK